MVEKEKGASVDWMIIAIIAIVVVVIGWWMFSGAYNNGEEPDRVQHDVTTQCRETYDLCAEGCPIGHTDRREAIMCVQMCRDEFDGCMGND